MLILSIPPLFVFRLSNPILYYTVSYFFIYLYSAYSLFLDKLRDLAEIGYYSKSVSFIRSNIRQFLLYIISLFSYFLAYSQNLSLSLSSTFLYSFIFSYFTTILIRNLLKPYFFSLLSLILFRLLVYISFIYLAKRRLNIYPGQYILIIL